MTLTVTRERRRLVTRMLRHGNASRLSDDERVVYTLGMLLADNSGRAAQETVVAAAQDPDMVAVAREVIRRALA